jgi:hypothetical protein
VWGNLGFPQKAGKKSTLGFEKWTFLKCPILKRWREVSVKKYFYSVML